MLSFPKTDATKRCYPFKGSISRPLLTGPESVPPRGLSWKQLTLGTKPRFYKSLTIVKKLLR